jgi:hypothetical protein
MTSPAMTAAGGPTGPGGGQPPPNSLPNFLVLDSTSLQDEQTNNLREHIRLDRIQFVFPEGFAKVPILEECRALCDLENFDVMYDLTMQYLAGKPLLIQIINNDGSRTTLGKCHVVDKHQDLRIMQCVNDYPWLIYWMVEFLAGHLSKKFPLPLSEPESPAASKKMGRARQKKNS